MTDGSTAAEHDGFYVRDNGTDAIASESGWVHVWVVDDDLPENTLAAVVQIGGGQAYLTVTAAGATVDDVVQRVDDLLTKAQSRDQATLDLIRRMLEAVLP